jgi:hypothetical protein
MALKFIPRWPSPSRTSRTIFLEKIADAAPLTVGIRIADFMASRAEFSSGSSNFMP